MAQTFRKEKLEKMMERLDGMREMWEADLKEDILEHEADRSMQSYMRGQASAYAQVMKMLQKEFDL